MIVEKIKYRSVAVRTLKAVNEFKHKSLLFILKP